MADLFRFAVSTKLVAMASYSWKMSKTAFGNVTVSPIQVRQKKNLRFAPTITSTVIRGHNLSEEGDEMAKKNLVSSVSWEIRPRWYLANEVHPMHPCLVGNVIC